MSTCSVSHFRVCQIILSIIFSTLSSTQSFFLHYVVFYLMVFTIVFPLPLTLLMYILRLSTLPFIRHPSTLFSVTGRCSEISRGLLVFIKASGSSFLLLSHVLTQTSCMCRKNIDLVNAVLMRSDMHLKVNDKCPVSWKTGFASTPNGHSREWRMLCHWQGNDAKHLSLCRRRT